MIQQWEIGVPNYVSKSQNTFVYFNSKILKHFCILLTLPPLLHYAPLIIYSIVFKKTNRQVLLVFAIVDENKRNQL